MDAAKFCSSICHSRSGPMCLKETTPLSLPPSMMAASRKARGIDAEEAPMQRRKWDSWSRPSETDQIRSISSFPR